MEIVSTEEQDERLALVAAVLVHAGFACAPPENDFRVETIAFHAGRY